MSAIVDPRFAIELRRLRQARGLTIRQLAVAVYYGKTLIHDLETGRRRPTVETAAALDQALDAGGRLAALVHPATPGLTPDDADRLRHAVGHPGTAGSATAEAVGRLLAGQRQLEDMVGADAVLAPVRAQLAVVVGLARDSGDHLLIDQAAQWAQYAGWLHIAIGDHRTAHRWLRQATEWAAVVGNDDLACTVLSFRAFAAEEVGDVPTMIELTRGTLVDPTIYVGQRAYDEYQLARGLAYTGDVQGALSAVAAGNDLAVATAEQTGEVPAWQYYRSPAFFTLEAGTVYAVLAEHAEEYGSRAVELLTTGLSRLPSDTQGAEWRGPYLCHLASAYAHIGDIASASTILDAARAAVGGSVRLNRRIESLARRIGLSAPT